LLLLENSFNYNPKIQFFLPKKKKHLT